MDQEVTRLLIILALLAVTATAIYCFKPQVYDTFYALESKINVQMVGTANLTLTPRPPQNVECDVKFTGTIKNYDFKQREANVTAGVFDRQKKVLEEHTVTVELKPKIETPFQIDFTTKCDFGGTSITKFIY